MLLLSSSFRVPTDNSVRDIVIYRVSSNHDSKLVSDLWDFWFKLISRQKDRPQRQVQSVLWRSFIPARKLFVWNHFWRFRLKEFFNNRSRPTGTEQARSGRVNAPGISSGQMTEKDLVDKCSSFIILRWDNYVPHWLPEYSSRIKLELSSAGTLWIKKDVILGCFTYPPPPTGTLWSPSKWTIVLESLSQYVLLGKPKVSQPPSVLNDDPRL